MKKPWVKIVVAVAAAAAVAAGGVWLAVLPSQADAAPRYESAPVTRGRVAAMVTASGTLSPLVTVQVGSQISGRVQALYADFNSHVKKGDVIARIDPSVQESLVQQARANEGMAVAAVRSAEAAVVEARRQHQRTTTLVAKDLVAQAEADTTLAKLESAEADVVSARAKVAQARAARVQAETNLGYTTITSPIDGVVISRDVDVGQTVAASLQAPLLFTLAEDLRKMEVHTDVAESDVGRVAAGVPVEFTVDAYPGDHFKGVVKAVRYAPKTVQNVVTYDAVVSVDNSSLKLRPGMTADVSFMVEELPDTLLVPNAALRFRPPDAATPNGAGDAGPGAARGPPASRTSPAPGAQASTPPAAGSSAAPTAGSPAPSASAGSASAPPGDRASAAAGGDDSGRQRRGSRRLVWVLSNDGTLRATQVHVGPSDGKSTAILSGELAVGDRVVTGMAGVPGGSTAQGQSAPNRRPGFGRFL
ncbi:MAG TPA: efflux RND transporter periplasmic adaptor subunit [Anaeromyxobacteraceae bacterium]|nr:efflux RND transporter periplasmic adaptor subunit [Anaeromyxobacteraceae bacterium]